MFTFLSSFVPISKQKHWSACSSEQNHRITLGFSLFPRLMKPGPPKHILSASPVLHFLGVLWKPKSPSSVPRPLAGVSSVLSSHSRWRNLFKQPYSGTTVLVPASVPASYCIWAQIPSVIYEVQCLCSSWPPTSPLCHPPPPLTLYSCFSSLLQGPCQEYFHHLQWSFFGSAHGSLLSIHFGVSLFWLQRGLP